MLWHDSNSMEFRQRAVRLAEERMRVEGGVSVVCSRGGRRDVGLSARTVRGWLRGRDLGEHLETRDGEGKDLAS